MYDNSFNTAENKLPPNLVSYNTMSTYFGIDYGSKFTGNTVIAILEGMDILFMEVEKKVNADQFILNAANHFKPDWIFLDAPLSLPIVYRDPEKGENFHFRQADLECRAMSPMFLGGLAARAMELKTELEAKDIPVFETYPRIRAKLLGLETLGYKTKKSAIAPCLAQIKKGLNPNLSLSTGDVKTWHHLDALLALLSAMAHETEDCQVYGTLEEGRILV